MSCFKIPSSNQPGWNLQNPQGRFGTFQVHHLAEARNPGSFGWKKHVWKSLQNTGFLVSLWKKNNLLFKYLLKLYYTGFLVNSDKVSFEISRPIQPIYMIIYIYIYCNCFFCAAASFCNFKGNTSNLVFCVHWFVQRLVVFPHHHLKYFFSIAPPYQNLTGFRIPVRTGCAQILTLALAIPPYLHV